MRELPLFDQDKYGNLKEIEFEIEEAEEQDVIDGMVQTGCPFAFMIDQVNSFLEWKDSVAAGNNLSTHT